MVHTDVLNSLSLQERDMLLFIVNIINPPLSTLEADLSILKTYKYSALAEIVKNSKGQVKDEALPIYENLCQKLNIQL